MFQPKIGFLLSNRSLVRTLSWYSWNYSESSVLLIRVWTRSFMLHATRSSNVLWRRWSAEEMFKALTQLEQHAESCCHSYRVRQ